MCRKPRQFTPKAPVRSFKYFCLIGDNLAERIVESAECMTSFEILERLRLPLSTPIVFETVGKLPGQ